MPPTQTLSISGLQAAQACLFWTEETHTAISQCNIANIEGKDCRKKQEQSTKGGESTSKERHVRSNLRALMSESENID